MGEGGGVRAIVLGFESHRGGLWSSQKAMSGPESFLARIRAQPHSPSEHWEYTGALPVRFQ
jgi:hypothetical protein